MNVPSNPKVGLSIAKKIEEILRYLKQERITGVVGGRLVQTPNGKSIVIDPNVKSKNPANTKTVPLTVIDSRPKYIPPPTTEPTPTSKRVFIEWGTLNDQIATNWSDFYDCTATTWFFAKAALQGDREMKVTSWEIVTGPNFNSHVTADWQVGGNRPPHAVLLLGVVLFPGGGGSPAVYNYGGGSLMLTEHITGIYPGQTAGDALLGKSLIFHRMVY